MDGTIHIEKSKALNSCAVPVKLICPFVFAHSKSRFSHDATQLAITTYYGHPSNVETVKSVSMALATSSKLSGLLIHSLSTS